MSDYNCRLMLETDLDDVVALVKKADDFAWSSQNIQESFYSINDKSFVLSTTTNIEVLGYAVIHTVLGESQLLYIAIKKQQQAKGLGEQFLQQLIELLKSQQQSSLLLEVRASNAKAIRLYEKLGFNRSGIRKAYYPLGNAKEDACLYSLSLD